MLLCIRQPKVELFSSADPLFVNVFVALPLGSDIEKTDKIVMELEEIIDETIEPYRGIVEAMQRR